jgi:hypothetical protein
MLRQSGEYKRAEVTAESAGFITSRCIYGSEVRLHCQGYTGGWLLVKERIKMPASSIHSIIHRDRK